LQGPNVWRTSSGQALVVIRAGPRSLRIRSNAQCACRLGPSVATSQAAGKVLVNLELSSSHPGHPSARLLETLLAAPAHSGLFFSLSFWCSGLGKFAVVRAPRQETSTRNNPAAGKSLVRWFRWGESWRGPASQAKFPSVTHVFLSAQQRWFAKIRHRIKDSDHLSVQISPPGS